MLNVLVNLSERIGEDLLEVSHGLHGRACYARLTVLLAIVVFELLRKRNLNEVAHVAAELTVAIADAEQVHLGQPLQVWLQDVRILVNFTRVVGMETDSSRERKFSNTVLALRPCLRRAAHRWRLMSHRR